MRCVPLDHAAPEMSCCGAILSVIASVRVPCRAWHAAPSYVMEDDQMAVLCSGIKGLKEKWLAYTLDGETPIPQRSIVSFVDILGYSAKVRDAEEKGETSKFLYEYRQALFAASDSFVNDASCYAFNFTDSVVVGWPIAEEDDSEVPLCASCWYLALYQLTMSQFDYFVRGGVAVGEAYFDEYVQSGKAFLDAYETEERQAIYPRIVLAEDAVAEVKKSCSYYIEEACPLDQLFAVDADGSIFINYLYSVFGVFSGDSDRCREDIEGYITNHREAIERNLVATVSKSYVYRKYQWAARYHDFFCEEISGWLKKDLTISMDYGKERFAPPRRLLDVFPDWIV